MRLICPNCDAEYEVDDGAIPLTGRDVQCSNCGHSWYQLPPQVMASVPDALPGEDDAASPADEEVSPAPQPDAAPSTPDVPIPPSARLTPAALALLKEEAAREIAARRVPQPAVEVQGDLGLQEPPPARPPTPVTTPESAPAVIASAGIIAGDPTPPTPRRARLPDIEEINSTLRPQAFPADYSPDPSPSTAEPDVEPANGSFSVGFVITLVIAVLLLLIYALAPQLGQAVPALKEPLDSYVGVVDAARLWLDGATRSLIDSLRGVAEPPA